MYCLDIPFVLSLSKHLFAPSYKLLRVQQYEATCQRET